ncbi:oxalurate catabolism protein HpxX [Erwinia sp. HDF1-3R]|uniref:oxalurate catabolism protein HpxX n=2 Tax=unclassified Erwinia TaxID=2622719 RepID=UPI00082EC342|nr:oxalurate catabolism protein HpxX [Erwinia sp. ErVv1]
MMSNEPDWAVWLEQMEQVLGVTLDDARRDALRVQFTRIATMAQPLMALPLDERLDVAGVYKA